MKKIFVAAAAGLFLASLGEAKAQLVYDNGPAVPVSSPYYPSFVPYIAFEIGAASGYSVSDSFTVSGDVNLAYAQIASYVATGDPMTSVDWSIGTTPFGSQISSGTSTTSSTSQITVEDFGFIEIDKNDFAVSGTVDSGTTYYFTLQNAQSLGGFAGWVINNGPSTAYESPYDPSGAADTLAPGSDSSAFRLYAAAPDSGSTIALLATAMTGLACIRRKFQS